MQPCLALRPSHVSTRVAQLRPQHVLGRWRWGGDEGHLDLSVGEVQGAQGAQAAEHVQRLGVDLGAEAEVEALQGRAALGDPQQRVVAQAVAEGGVQRLQRRAVQRQAAQHAAAPAGSTLGVMALGDICQ